MIDPQARHAHKTVKRRQDGFKAHLAFEPETGITTACELTKAAGAASDSATGIRLLAADDTINGDNVGLGASVAEASSQCGFLGGVCPFGFLAGGRPAPRAHRLLAAPSGYPEQ